MATVFWSTPHQANFDFSSLKSFFVPPPTPGSTDAAPPFSFSDSLYHATLKPSVPITIALAYAVTVTSLNKYNRSTGKKPWAISQTRAFFWFVVLHNVFLAVYSAWTFWGMLGALRRGVASPFGSEGLAGTVDSFCRLSGAPGLGNGAFYSDSEQQWLSHSAQTALTAEGPSRFQGGRIWNEGLSFYGWLFYLSKFYEVVDTFIILSKGKLSSTLQTYHHAGAMMCMWAGMRFMGNPIWMFVFFNSFIHAMMYTYYTITAFSIKVPQFIKRTLTTLQITQFIVGASYAMLHSFVSYTIPVVVSVAQPSSAPVNATAEASPRDHFLGSLKNLLLGAVAKADVQLGHTANEDPIASPAAAPAVTYGHKVVPCVTTSSETFAIWLNVLYLAPLTYLFVKFFITSYIRRSTAESARYRKAGGEKGRLAAIEKESALEESRRRISGTVTLAEKATWDAAKGLQREIYRESCEGDSCAIEDDNVAAAAPVQETNGASPRATRSKKGKSRKA